MIRAETTGLGAMVRAGGRALSEYTGMLFGLFLIQALTAWGAGVAMQGVLSSVFAGRPLFDEGVDGDVVALIEALRGAGAVVAAIGWLAAGAIVTWMLLTLFLHGGLIAVLAERPTGRRDTVRCFGGGGAATYFVFLRLALMSMACHLVILVVATLGLGAVADRIDQALTLREVIVALLVGLSPALLLTILVWTIIDYARVELVLRRAGLQRPGAAVAFVRAAVFVFRRPVALLHQALWLAAFVAASVLYAWAAHGPAMLGTSGAISLLVIREGLALVRMAFKVALTAGQVELSSTRPPPVRVSVPIDAD
ncbi:MAG: hypothetical protein KC464_29780 [Myxococcales bacterium]|nr:hypothetical protein [Myxococcales bacterium]